MINPENNSTILEPIPLVSCAKSFDEAVESAEMHGDDMMEKMARLFPICRSLTGAGIRETFDIIGETVPLRRHKIATGEKVYDWTVPKEWNIKDAYIKNSKGEKIVDFNKNNLHVVGYSTPIRTKLSLADLRPHLHTLPNVPEAVPYITSYYTERWGFCLSQNQLDSLEEDTYEVVIESTLEDGFLELCDARIGPEDSPEIVVATYCCHPSIANNELSGPVLTTKLYEILSGINDLRFSYRFLFMPETIGPIAYMSMFGEELKSQVHAGYVVSCVGDDGPYTYKKSRRGNSAADISALHMLRYLPTENSEILIHDFFPDAGGDERQYNSPGFNLPIGSLLRSNAGTYREYHTSLDNLDFVSARGMAGSLSAYLRIFQTLEMNTKLLNIKPNGEPQLGKYGLYPGPGVHPRFEDEMRYILYLLCYADGENDLMAIADMVERPIWALTGAIDKLAIAQLISDAPV